MYWRSPLHQVEQVTIRAVGASYTSTVHYVNLVQASYLFNLRHLLAVQLTCARFVPQFTDLLLINDRYVARELIYKKADYRESKTFKNSYVCIYLYDLAPLSVGPKCIISDKVIYLWARHHIVLLTLRAIVRDSNY